MNNLKLETLIQSIRKEGQKNKSFYNKTIAIALWNSLTKEDRKQVFEHLDTIKQEESEFALSLK